MTVALGLLYPLAVTGISQVFFSNAANGSKVSLNGKTVGSKLIGQEFKGKGFFYSRPSATGYSGDVTYFGNVGPNSVAGREGVSENIAAYMASERPFDRGLTKDGIPVDAVTQSASGVDPEISEANALIQAHRIAAIRHLPLEEVDALISDHTAGRGLGVFGEPGVNVLELNVALEEAVPLR